MSDLELFIVGTFITVLVAIAMIPLIWAAVLDGRDQAASEKRLQASPAAESHRQ